MKLKRLFVRMWYYFRVGYSTYISFPFAFAGYISAIYFLTISNSLLLMKLFPMFSMFLLVMLLAIPTIAIFLGWIHYKRSPLFKEEQMIAIESNPYSTPIFKFYYALAKKLELPENAQELGKLLQAMRVEGFN